MRKLSVIRSNDQITCPFGLPIPFGCMHAGKLIDKMAPINSLGPDSSVHEKDHITDANVRLLSWNLAKGNDEGQCPYANEIMEKSNTNNTETVNCNYEDTAPGQSSKGYRPYFQQDFVGYGAFNGINSFPLGMYDDFNSSRNNYYGIYSVQGSINDKNLAIKQYKKEA
jgi:hypothetical protein